MPLEVRPVIGAQDITAFLRAPFAIYADDPAWVAPLFLERREHLDPGKNPWFQHADAQLFMAVRDGLAVGRISAQVDRLRAALHSDGVGQFGFLEAIDDADVFRALTEAAEHWLAARGVRRIQGPFSFSINDETGLLVDGFETPPSMMMGHAKPYYGHRLEALGYAKVKDVIAYDYDARLALPPAMARMVAKAKASGEMRLRTFSKAQLTRDLAIIIDIFNDAWSENWGFVPMTDAEITALGKNLKLLVKDGFIAIAEVGGEPAAMAVSLPNLNVWIAGLQGRLLPFGWVWLIARMLGGPPASVRIPLMGVRRRFHGTPLGAALALGVIDQVRGYHMGRGTHRAELSWILEDNMPMRRMIEALGAKAYKTYRVYEKPL